MTQKIQTICDTEQSLTRETLKLVQADKRGLIAVSFKTGVPFYWLRKFAAGQIPKPNANRVQFLYEKLSGRKISL